VVAKAKKTTANKKPTASSATKVTRIKAADSQPAVSTLKQIKAPKTVGQEPAKKPTAKLVKPLKALGSYFKGAWFELRQVHWPDRKATWGLTGAVLIFTAFFIVLILLLDMLFKYIFELILV
jgi:preprotein translocase SecE subunit